MYETKKLNVFIDAEWDSKEQFISFQALITGKGLPSGKYIVFHSQYRDFLESRGFVEGFHSSGNFTIVFEDFSDQEDRLTKLIFTHLQNTSLSAPTNQLAGNLSQDDSDDLSDEVLDELLHDVPEELVNVEQMDVLGELDGEGLTSVSCNLYLFYSPKDIYAGIGFDKFKEIVFSHPDSGASLNQKRNLTGSFVLNYEQNFRVRYKIKDISGWTNKGLESLSDSLGISTLDKKGLDDYKSCMENALKDYPLAFIRYALNDVVLLRKILYRQIQHVNAICEFFSIPFKFNQETIPLTQGRLVSTVFRHYLENLLEPSSKFSDLPKKSVLQMTFAKLGVLEPDIKKYRTYQQRHKKLFENVNPNFLSTPKRS